VGVLRLLRAAAGSTLTVVATAALGAPLGRAYALGVARYLACWGPIADAPIISERVQSTVMPYAPSTAIILPLILGALYAALLGPEVLARTVEVVAWPLLPGMAALAALPWLLAHWALLWPAWQPGPVRLDGDFWSYAIGLRGFAVVLPLCAFVDGSSARLPVRAGLMAGWLLTTAMYLEPHALFPTPALARLAIPELAATAALSVRSLAVDSLVSVSIPLWYTIAFVVTAFTAWGAGELAGQALGVRDRRLTTTGAAAVQSLSALPAWTSQLPALLPWWSLYGYAACVLGPWLIVAALARRRAAPMAA
jgi:hypothetical protein